MQPQEKNTNFVIDANGSLTENDQETAEALLHYYSSVSKMVFNREDRKIGRRNRKLVNSSTIPASNQLFNDLIRYSELLFAIRQINVKKFAGSHGIH
ncbi:hypothetical protein NPIL_331851 [Nephila pilipes]|uniref:Uncharacterized protein n=1 Tax=Nephila pilipes TaxID=299642 RepID=A0A8X6Q3D4_NEPPI|nr:hypothetical protein NPIL_331851 [Nephila pilipes]